MSIISSQRWIGRTIILCCVLLLPFVRFILHQRNGLFHPEVLVPLGIGLLACGISGAILRWRSAFAAVVILLITFQSAFAVHSGLEPFWTVEYLWITVATFEVLLLTWMVTKDVFFRLVVVFSLGMLFVALAQAALRGAGTPAVASAAPTNTSAQPRVVYIIFDELLGLSGFPRDIPECAGVAGKLQTMLLRYGFDVYPDAYSNYFYSIESIPSILNFRLGPESLVRQNTLTSERLFSEFLHKGYKVVIYQSDYLSFRAPSLDVDAIAYTYEAANIRPIENLPIDWQDKTGHVVGSYIKSDGFFREIVAPFGESYWFSRERFNGPLSISDLWPTRLKTDILNSHGKTMFFAHLLTPHHPYVFDGQDRLRDYAQWGHRSFNSPSDSDAYRSVYRNYCEQVLHLTHEMDDFLKALKQNISYDSTTIIFHGDHGSRIVLSDHSEIRPRDLVDAYSTLFAVKPASPRSGHLMSGKTSVLRLLVNNLVPREAAGLPDEVDDVFLQNGMPVPILDLWKENE